MLGYPPTDGPDRCTDESESGLLLIVPGEEAQLGAVGLETRVI